MLVYRLCDKNEAFYILNNGIFDNVGGLGKTFNCNDHNYLKRVRYMHFFKDKMSVFYVGFQGDGYICTYDIPEDILNQGRGMGKYRSPIDLREFVLLEEFAVKSSDMKIEYLRKVESLGSLSFKEVLTNGLDDDALIPIYIDENSIKRS